MSKLSTLNSHLMNPTVKNNYSNIKPISVSGDNTNHPEHYNLGTECIELMIETQGTDAVLNFCTCNAFKYLYRHQFKGKDEDIQKAKWYIDKYLELKQLQEECKRRKQLKLVYKQYRKGSNV